MSSILNILTIAGVVIVALLVIGIILARLYKRASKETAYVRTGLSGSKVIVDGGALVLPVFHEILGINLKTHKLVVKRAAEEALITNDKLRADVTVEFYVRVAKEKEAIEQAAQSLGDRTNDPDALKELVEGKFVDALRAVAAEMTLENLHLKRADFVQRVQQVVTEDLRKNGLELESASLVGLDQTDKKYFNPLNAFDAEGLTRLTEITETRRKERFNIEATTKVEIAEREREATQQTLSIERQTEEAKLEQQRDLANKRAETTAATAGREAEGRKAAEQARITADREIAEADIDRNKAVQLAEQRSAIEIANQSRDKSAAEAEANTARAAAVRSEEAVETARAVETANREKAVNLVAAEQKAEQEAIGVRVQAKADREAAEERAQAVLVEAKASAEAETIKAGAAKVTLEVQANGERQINEARNLISEGVIGLQIKMKTIESLPAIIAAATKPMEKIDSIKLVQVTGLGGAFGGGNAAEDASLPDQCVSAALRHQAVSPLLKDLMAQVGFDGNGGLNGLVGPAAAIAAQPALVAPAAPAAPAARETAKTTKPGVSSLKSGAAAEAAE